MTKRMIILMTVALLVGLAGSAMANRIDSFSASADCDGWSVEGTAKIGQADRPGVYLDYTVEMSQNGVVLQEQTGQLYVRALMDADPFSIAGSFEDMPAGSVVISGTFVLPVYDTGEVSETFSIEMSCGAEAVAKRPNFWRRNPNAWPVQNIEIGGVLYTKEQARDMMRGCFNHRVVKRLFRHTLAAKLNAANGVSGEPTQLIIDAEAYLASHNFHNRLPRSERREARLLKNQLREYNRGDSNKALSDDESDFNDYDEEMTLNDMKAMYR